MQLDEQGLLLAKSLDVQPAMGVLYAFVHEVEKPEICWNWDSVMEGEEDAVERADILARTRHARSASFG